MLENPPQVLQPSALARFECISIRSPGPLGDNKWIYPMQRKLVARPSGIPPGLESGCLLLCLPGDLLQRVLLGCRLPALNPTVRSQPLRGGTCFTAVASPRFAVNLFVAASFFLAVASPWFAVTFFMAAPAVAFPRFVDGARLFVASVVANVGCCCMCWLGLAP